ncbi:alpha/beta hydrolase [Streptococcus merionis]|uniref:alpha/beta hydrolase n=1 Tax=Streptococcus merionis TaxID=400065 RepID=UPI0026EBE239|nr:alpha/beta hydrolase [Streptococcus merionis]
MLHETLTLFEGTDSYLDIYIQNPEISFGVTKTRPLILICPGGAYVDTATKEGEATALAFLALGYHVAVLRYRTYRINRVTINPHAHFEGYVRDIMEAMKLIDDNREVWGIDGDAVFVCGFSAGGHLTGYLGLNWDDPDFLSKYYPHQKPSIFKPKGLIMCYAPIRFEDIKADPQGLSPEMIEMLHQALFNRADEAILRPRLDLTQSVRSDMPPVFLWHTMADKVTSVSGAVSFVQALLAQDVPCEAHFYQKGKHGLGVATDTHARFSDDVNTRVQTWLGLADAWIRGVIEDDKEITNR